LLVESLLWKALVEVAVGVHAELQVDSFIQAAQAVVSGVDESLRPRWFVEGKL